MLCIATHCNTLFVPTEHVVHCNALQHTICTNRTCCALQRTATHYLHQQKTHCNTLFVRTRSPRVSISAIQSHCGDYICELQHTSAHCNTFSAHCNAFVAHCNTLQFTTSNNRTWVTWRSLELYIHTGYTPTPKMQRTVRDNALFVTRHDICATHFWSRCIALQFKRASSHSCRVVANSDLLYT